jgi:ribosomal protein L24
MKTIEYNGMRYSVGDMVKVTKGADRNKTGTIYKFYKADDIFSVAVKYEDTNYGMYQIDSIELA